MKNQQPWCNADALETEKIFAISLLICLTYYLLDFDWSRPLNEPYYPFTLNVKEFHVGDEEVDETIDCLSQYKYLHGLPN